MSERAYINEYLIRGEKLPRQLHDVQKRPKQSSESILLNYVNILPFNQFNDLLRLIAFAFIPILH